MKKRSNSEASRRGRASRNKGKVYERDCANALKRVYPDAKRGVGQARTGSERPDVIGTPFWIECGAGQTIKIHDKLRQAFNDSAVSNDEVYAGAVAIVMSKSVRGENVVSMDRDVFIDLLEELENLRRSARNGRGKVQVRPMRKAS